MPTRRLATGLFGSGAVLAAAAAGIRLLGEGTHDASLVLAGGAVALVGAAVATRLHARIEPTGPNSLAILDRIGDVAYVGDPDTYEVLWANRAFHEAWGGLPRGGRCHDALSASTEPCNVCSNTKIFGPNLGKTHVWEHQSDVNGHWYRSSDRAIRWLDGRWVRLSISTDLTKQREAIVALRAAKERLEIATASASLGIWEFDATTGALSWDDRLVEMHGLTRDEFHGTFEDWAARCHPEDFAATQEALTHALETRTVFERTFRIVRKQDGAIRWFDAYGLLVEDEETGTRRMLGVNQDVTPRETTLRDLARSNKELEQFAYVASHDLQEPLRMVSSYTQLLADRFGDHLDEKARMYVHYAVDGATRMQSLIKDLLTFSRVVRHQRTVEIIDLRHLVDEALTNLAEPIAESRAKIEIGDLPSIEGNRSQFLQVLQNLISNAIKFRTPDTAPHVTIDARRTQDGYVLSIRDDGIGIDSRYRDKIFEVFERLHSEQEYAGTGIGLAISQRVVEHHGGRIWVDSEVGRGSTFHIHLPTAIVPSTEEAHVS